MSFKIDVEKVKNSRYKFTDDEREKLKEVLFRGIDEDAIFDPVFLPYVDIKATVTRIDNKRSLTVKEMFKDYHGETISVKPYIFESMGNEKW